jgi:ABC-type nitrate/sulfonate/bicarbonate transport system permease component
VRIPVSVQHWIVPVAVLAAWEAFGRTGLLPHYLPAPSVIAAALLEATRDGELPHAMAISLFRVSIGFVFGAGSGMLFGLGAGLVPGIRNFFDPLVAFLFAVPKIAFLPIFLLLFGLGKE